VTEAVKTGVVHSLGPLPPLAPGPIASTLKKVVHEALGELPPGTSGAAVHVTSDAGVNLVFAHRGASGNWQVDAFVGRKWGNNPVTFEAKATILW
jgi:hypothetical protein